MSERRGSREVVALRGKEFMGWREEEGECVSGEMTMIIDVQIGWW